MRIRKRARAKSDALEIYAHLANESERTGERFLANLDRSLHLLTVNPHIGRRAETKVLNRPALRIWQVPEFEDILIFYASHEDEIEVVRILHGKRDLPSLL